MLWLLEDVALHGLLADTIKFAVQCGRMAPIEVLVAQGARLPQDACAIAALHAHSHVVEYAHARGCAWNGEVMRAAALSGNVHTLAFVHARGLSLDACDWHRLLREGPAFLHALRYARANGWTPNQNSFQAVLDSASGEMMRFLVEECGYPIDADAVMAVIESKRMDILRYLVDSARCTLDERMCEAAARRGYVGVLSYLRERGCPWDRDACLEAATERRKPACVDYIKRRPVFDLPFFPPPLSVGRGTPLRTSSPLPEQICGKGPRGHVVVPSFGSVGRARVFQRPFWVESK
jgi:hypothetical protein